MYYEIIGWVGQERHNLGWTDSKYDARDWAYFCMFNRGYESCDIITEEGEVIAHYKKGQQPFLFLFAARTRSVRAAFSWLP